MPTDPPWQLVEAECEALLTSLRGTASTSAHEMPSHYAHILGMYWRCVRLFDAALQLLKAELPEEAAIIARSLFEDSLRLQQVAADDVDRDALVLGWANDSISERFGLLQVAKSLGLDDDISVAEGKLNDQRRVLQAFQLRRGVKKLKRFAAERQASVRFGRADDFWAYSLSHELVHGSDVAWLFARRSQGTDVGGLHAKTSDPGIRAAFAEFAAGSVTAAAKAAAAIFPFLQVEAIDDSLANIRKLLENGAG